LDSLKLDRLILKYLAKGGRGRKNKEGTGLDVLHGEKKHSKNTAYRNRSAKKQDRKLFCFNERAKTFKSVHRRIEGRGRTGM